MLMDTTKAHELLGWTPRFTAAQTLAATVAAQPDDRPLDADP